MRKAVLCAVINSTLLLHAVPCFGQIAAEINTLLKKSKFVDTGRMVNTNISPDRTIISTYANPRASDQDCKVTALLMMKELHQHYKKIHRIDVLFYDPADPKSYREVEIREGDILLVDQGKPLQEVLSQIDVAHHTSAPTPNAVSLKGARQARSTTMAGHGNSLPSYNSPSGFVSFRSPDNDVSLSYPKDWIFERTDPRVILFKASIASNEGTGVLGLYRQVFEGETLDSMVNMHQNEEKINTKNYKAIVHRSINCNGLPGIYTEFSGVWLTGSSIVERCAYVKSQNRYYMLTMITYGVNDSDMNRIFQTVLSSLRIQG
jgi:PsbP-like protein